MLLVGTDFIDNNASFNTQLKRDGAKVLVYAYAGTGVDENTPAVIQFMGSGYNATALIASVYGYVGVPEGTQSVGAGSWGWFIIRGPVESVQGSAAEAVGSIGHAVAWTGAAIYASSSAHQGLSHQIGVLTTAANASTTLDIYLTGVYATPV
jgi:hypothetical protein